MYHVLRDILLTKTFILTKHLYTIQ